jgi:uncharacterized RmlC-like cupin family protein
VGAKTLFLGLVTLPPGGRTKSHIHAAHESAFYMLSGDEVEVWARSPGDPVIAVAGDIACSPSDPNFNT